MFLVHLTLSPLLQHHWSFLLFGHLHRYPLRHVTASQSKVAILCAPPKAENSDQMYFIPIVHLFLVQGAAGEEAGEKAGEEAGEEAEKREEEEAEEEAREEAEEEAGKETWYKALRTPTAIPGICSIIHLTCSSCLLLTSIQHQATI